MVRTNSRGADRSPSQYQVKILYTRVPMRDGVELGVKITRPDAEGRFPAIMEYNPYRRIRKPLADYREEYPPVVPYLAERGYVIAQFDVRGTGNSSGWSKDIYSAGERQDGYDMVEWIAAQSWCNGNVGMIGKSYSAVVQWQVAVQAPPHLKAIIVRSANDNVYTEWTYPGGVLRPYMFDSYSALMNTYNFSPPDPDIVGEKWSEIWQQRLENSQPWGIGYLSNQLDGPYWQDRSLSTDYGAVQCAVFVIAGWSDCYPTALLRAFSNLKVPHKRALVGPWGHWYGEEECAVPGPRIDTRPLYLKWFDRWLKGIDNGAMDEPPVTFFVKRYSPPSARMPLEEKGFWRSEREWPIARTRRTPLYFHSQGKMSPEPCEAVDEERDEYPYNPGVGITSGIHWGGGILPWGTPIDQRWDEAYSVTYTTPPLEADLEVTGTPTAVIYVSSTAEVAYFRVKLIDVAPDGTSKLVRYGGLNATHRDSHFDPEPLIPGEVYELRIDLKTMSYIFGTGHRIRVAIASADIQNAWPTAEPAINAIHRGSRHPSHIILPVIPEQNAELPQPDLVRLSNADPQGLSTPEEYSITHDLVNQKTIFRIAPVHVPDSAGFDLQQHSSLTVSTVNPAEAVLKAFCAYTLKQLGSDIRIEANELTTSDESAFRHLVQLTITVDGKLHFNKSWSHTVPRLLN